MEVTQDQRILVGWTTLPDEASALRLAREAVRTGAAACAQVSAAVTSIYVWEGKVCEDTEYRITFKLSAAKELQLRTLLQAAHPYQVPQWVAVPVSHALPEYAQWVLSADAVE